MSCPQRAGPTRAQDSFLIRVSYDLSLGADTAPLFLFSDGRIHRISIRKVMKSGASYISKHILSLSLVRSGEGRKTRALTERGTALFFLRPDHLRPNREGSGTMRCCKRMSERLRRASTHYATRMFFLSQERSLRVRRPCVSPDRGPESVGAYAIPEIWEGNTGKCDSESRERVVPLLITYPNPDNPFIRSAAGQHLAQGRRSCRTPFSDDRQTLILRP